MRTFLVTLSLVTLCLFDQVSQGATTSELRFRATARRRIAADLQAGRLDDLAVRGMDAILARGNSELRKAGFDAVADVFDGDWADTFRPQFLANSYDMGDHPPWSGWVSDWYAAVEARLGVTVCEFFHLRDVFVINYGWPVVKDPHFDTHWCAETLEKEQLDTCRQEYIRHAAGTKFQREDDPYANAIKTFGVFPVASYWVTFVICESQLWGADGSFLCGPAATAVEITTARYLAPPVFGRIWDRNNP